jgi:hypothetical protein
MCNIFSIFIADFYKLIFKDEFTSKLYHKVFLVKEEIF